MRDRAPITCPGELLAALLAGDRLTNCTTTGLRFEEANRAVDRAAMKVLRMGVRLVAACDALPGIGSSQTFLLEPMLDRMDVAFYLRSALRDAGGPAAFARSAGLTRSQVTDVDGGRIAPTPALLASLGLVRLERYGKAPRAQNEAAA